MTYLGEFLWLTFRIKINKVSTTSQMIDHGINTDIFIGRPLC